MAYVRFCVLCYWISAWHPLGGFTHCCGPGQYKLAWMETRLCNQERSTWTKPDLLTPPIPALHSSVNLSEILKIISPFWWPALRIWMIKRQLMQHQQTVTENPEIFFRKHLHKNKSAHWHINSHSHNLQMHRLIVGTYEKCNAFLHIQKYSQVWQGYNRTRYYEEVKRVENHCSKM